MGSGIHGGMEGGPRGGEGETESTDCPIILQTKHVVGDGAHDEGFVASFMGVDSRDEDVLLESTQPVVR